MEVHTSRKLWKASWFHRAGSKKLSFFLVQQLPSAFTANGLVEVSLRVGAGNGGIGKVSGIISSVRSLLVQMLNTYAN